MTEVLVPPAQHMISDLLFWVWKLSLCTLFWLHTSPVIIFLKLASRFTYCVIFAFKFRGVFVADVDLLFFVSCTKKHQPPIFCAYRDWLIVQIFLPFGVLWFVLMGGCHVRHGGHHGRFTTRSLQKMCWNSDTVINLWVLWFKVDLEG